MIVLSPPEGLSATCPVFSVVVMTTVLASPLVLVVEVKSTRFLFGFICRQKGLCLHQVFLFNILNVDPMSWRFIFLHVWQPLLVKIIIVTSAPLALELIAGFVLIYQNYLI